MPHENTPEHRLARAVEKLTSPYTTEHVQRVPGGGRRIVHSKHTALIGMLRTASLSSTGAHSIGGAQSRSVIDADAIEKLRQLRLNVGDLWENLVPGAVAAGILRQRLTLEESLTGWHRMFQTYRQHDAATDDDVYWAGRMCDNWVRTIETKFDPVRTIEITAPCPVCGERWATAGEHILAARVSALTLSFAGTAASATATCRSCGTVWRGEEALRALDKLQRDAADTPIIHNILLPTPGDIPL